MKPRRSIQTLKPGLIMAAAGVLLLAGWVAIAELRTHSTAVAGERKAASTKASAIEAGTLDPMLFQGRIREAYKVARENPGLLAQLHCYCGCDQVYGHKNLLDCFRDKHGSHCDICVGEALEASRLDRDGSPVEQIRDALRARFDRGG